MIVPLLSAVALAAAQPELPLVPSPPPPAPARGSIPPRRGQANLASYFSADDYPPGAIRAGEEGMTGFSLRIGVDGRVASCTITSSSGSALLDDTTCRILLSRARYIPARDDLGRPTIGFDAGRVSWVLPVEEEEEADDPFAPPAVPPAMPARPEQDISLYFRAGDYPPEAIRAGEQGIVSFDVAIDADGRAFACRVTASSGSPILDQEACDIVVARARFHPALDAAGAAVPGLFSSWATWRLPRR